MFAGHSLLSGSGGLHHTDSRQSLPDSNLLPLPPHHPSASGFALKAQGRPPSASHLNGRYTNDRKASMLAHHLLSSRGNDSSALMQHDTGGQQSQVPPAPMMYRVCSGSSAQATPSHASRQASVPSALLTSPAQYSTSSFEVSPVNDMCGSIMSMHGSHGFVVPEPRKRARWNTMSQEEITGLSTLLSSLSAMRSDQMIAKQQSLKPAVVSSNENASSEALARSVLSAIASPGAREGGSGINSGVLQGDAAAAEAALALVEAHLHVSKHQQIEGATPVSHAKASDHAITSRQQQSMTNRAHAVGGAEEAEPERHGSLVLRDFNAADAGAHERNGEVDGRSEDLDSQHADQCHAGLISNMGMHAGEGYIEGEPYTTSSAQEVASSGINNELDENKASCTPSADEDCTGFSSEHVFFPLPPVSGCGEDDPPTDATQAQGS
jgi:hypothetical protein